MIAAAAWKTLTALCEQAYPREACGWLTATGAEFDQVRAATTGGRRHFAFSDDDLLAFAAASRTPTPPGAIFHSHPDGNAVLSPADHALLAPRGVVLHPVRNLVIAVAGGYARAARMIGWVQGHAITEAYWRRNHDAWTLEP